MIIQLGEERPVVAFPHPIVTKMASNRVLILGGHGKVSLLLTALLLKEPGWHVSSVIRDPRQKDEVLELGKDQQGEIEVLVESLEEVQSVQQAKQLLSKADPKMVVFSAGGLRRAGRSLLYSSCD
jgi:NADPH:quinone reductase-like Zn-dependent oxidoreductase